MHLGRIMQVTMLEPRSARDALVVLIQHGIVAYAVAKEGQRAVAYYSISLKNILRILRSGLYLALVEERMGKDGLAIFKTIMVNGCMTISDARSALGFSKMDAASKIKFNAVVTKLVRERFISAVSPVDTISKLDRIMEAEAKEIEKLTVPPTAKELLAIRRRINEQEEEAYLSSTVVGIKRKAANDTNGDSHSAKIQLGPNGKPFVVGNGLGINGLEGEEQAQPDVVDDAQFFRPYCDRLDVFLRNQQIINYFTDKYNSGAGAVIKSILRLTESRIKTCRDRQSDTVSASQVIQNIHQDAPLADAVDMGSDMFYENLATSDPSSKANGDGGGLTRAKRGEIVYALLEVLQSDASGIVAKTDERGAGQYRIDFERAANTLRDQCVDALVQEKFGSLHARVVRVLRDKQKLDEKTVSQAAMLPMGMCRERLHDLALVGLIDTVEVPRGADRNPSRMIYLWYVNSEKQVRAAMRYAFQGISNIIQRLSHELDARAPLIAKTKRNDVIKDPSLLTDSERKELKQLDEIKQRLQVAIVRLDSMLLIVHDINPLSTDLQLL
ncbi:RNA polymerase III subunit C82 [Dipsacomyces acuminosporus]|nr:RNA polymerase III subunit C82 [Dipsacomyces acuminosporus]